MIFQKLESSNIAAAGYDATTSTMGVLFQGGGLYFYPGVAQRAYDAFLAAESVGKYLNTEIKPHYNFFKVENLSEFPSFQKTGSGEENKDG